jgi:hypothetical protein
MDNLATLSLTVNDIDNLIINIYSLASINRLISLIKT